MVRQVIEINEEKCNGCGICANACHESAIAIVNGKAKLVRDDYCDGFGDCLPACPTGAIRFVQREAADYDVKAVTDRLKAMGKDPSRAETRQAKAGETHRNQPARHAGCPGSAARSLQPPVGGCPGSAARSLGGRAQGLEALSAVSALRNWPVQIKLAPVQAPYFDGADLLIAADCSAYAYAAFHRDFLAGRVCLVGCPKLDGVNYAEKLTQIIAANDIRSLTIVRMEVPCCGGIETAGAEALKASGRFIPWRVVTLSLDGKILADR